MVQYDYDPFGNIIEQTGDVNNSITYAGYQYDAETDLYYLNARYYDSKIARFISEDTYKGDPNDPLSLNLYTYCHNEPIMYSDPTGHWEEGDGKLSPEAQAQIAEATIEYLKAKECGDTDAMESANQKAIDARNGNIYNASKLTESDISDMLNYINASEYVSEGAKSDLDKSDFSFIAKKPTNTTDLKYKNNCINQINNARINSTYVLSSITEDELRYKLKRQIKIDLNAIEYYKNVGFYNTDECLDIILKYDAEITKYSEQLGVPKEMIQAILMKELRMMDIRDNVDLLVKNTYNYKNELEEYDKLPFLRKIITGEPIPPIIWKEDSSTGLGQIFANTAIEALNYGIDKGYITDERKYDSSNWKDVEKMWNRLQDDEQNIYFVAVVLSFTAKRYVGCDDLNNATERQIQQTITNYNGFGEQAQEYGREVLQYYYLFKQYNKGK